MAGKRNPPADPKHYDAAVGAWRRRVPVADSKMAALVKSEGKHAWTVAAAGQADLVQQVFDAIDSAVANGDTFEDFKDSVGGRLESAWGKRDPARLETIFRTNVMAAYNEGRYELMSSPAVMEATPYWRFDAVEDDRTSEICDELAGTVLPADDDFWGDHQPPLHCNCRSIVTPLTPEEADEEGIDETPETESEPDEGFGSAPDEPGEDWTPDLESYDDNIAGVLRDRLDEEE